MVEKCTLILILLSVLWFGVLEGKNKLPNTFERCKRHDPNLNLCLQSAIQHSIPLLKPGLSELGVPPLDPLVVTNINIQDGAGRPVKINLDLNNANLRGLGDADLQAVRADLDNQFIEIKGHVPITKIDADYVMDGKFLVLPLRGSGKCNMTLTDYDVTVKVRSQPMEKNGKVHWDVKDFDLHVDSMKRFEVYFDNLFNGDKELGDNTNKVLNENWESFFEELRPTLHETFGTVFQRISNLIFHKVPESDIFLES